MTSEPRSRRFAEFGCALLLDVVCIGVTAAIMWLSRRRARTAMSQDPHGTA